MNDIDTRVPIKPPGYKTSLCRTVTTRKEFPSCSGCSNSIPRGSKSFNITYTTKYVRGDKKHHSWIFRWCEECTDFLNSVPLRLAHGEPDVRGMDNITRDASPQVIWRGEWDEPEYIQQVKSVQYNYQKQIHR